MDNNELKDFCLSLMHADSEGEVERLIKEAGYWNAPDAWRNYGDVEINYSQAGNQANTPEAALVEKLTNARDARLMNACLERGIDPEGPEAPGSLEDAVAEFFEENADSEIAGQIKEWSDRKRREIAEGATLASTGAMASADRAFCLTISDCGEGQTPDRMPHTLLSLEGSIKMRIPFVHGRFNMGGTAALRFCGEQNFQLVLSRRNPAFLDEPAENPSDHKWGFTVVHRDFPEGQRGNSVYRYLAPAGSDENPNKGGVLRFSADSMPIFPEGQDAYARESEWGTLIKLYEYEARSTSKIVGGKSSLLYSLAVRLPNIGLPVRLYECRSSFRGHGGSHETTLSGLKIRLHDDRGKNLEDDYPTFHPMRVDGNDMRVAVYAFKDEKAYTYRYAEDGILFTLNGQTQGSLHDRFFTRKKVKKSYLKKSLLVIVDCSYFSDRAVEEFFMNSRDRLSTVELRQKVEERLEKLLKEHKGLRALQEQRRREKKKEKLDGSKPLENVLNSLIEQSHTLSKLFLDGERLPNPFKPESVQDEEEEPYEGKRFPTYFKLKKVDYGETLSRSCHLNRRCRISFETDATNDYFGRKNAPGTSELFLVNGENRTPVKNYDLNPHDGTATLNFDLPSNCQVGDELHYLAEVTDPTQIEPFENRFILNVRKPAKPSGSGSNGRKDPPGDEEGNDRDAPGGLQLPDVREVYESSENGKLTWDEVPHGSFDKHSALRVIDAGSSDEDDAPSSYDFYVNMDNLYLNSEIKSSGEDEEVVASQFKYGMVLIGLSLLHQSEQAGEKQESEDSRAADGSAEDQRMPIEEKVEDFTKGAAMVLLPVINELGALDLESEMVNAS